MCTRDSLHRLSEIDVRRVRAHEWEALRDTRLQALADEPDAFATTHADASARPEEWWRDWALRSADGDDQAMFLAWRDGEPIGIAGAFRTGRRIDVISMWTNPANRGQGIGRALLDAAVAFAGEAEVHLAVTETNAGARSFYERGGFVPTGSTEPLREGSSLVAHDLVLRR
jgi:GNAT superfamily N-acetyltransferase